MSSKASTVSARPLDFSSMRRNDAFAIASQSNPSPSTAPIAAPIAASDPTVPMDGWFGSVTNELECSPNDPPAGVASIAASAALSTNTVPPPTPRRPVTGLMSESHSSGLSSAPWSLSASINASEETPSIPIFPSSAGTHSSSCSLHAALAASSTAWTSLSVLPSKDPELAVSYAARIDARRTAPNVPYAWSRSTTVDANASAWLAAPFSRTQ
mmetsp:Transcript_769/g.2725  ORF Transcript_769/g.2725 Transcript_769/m.2725 type:complete len:213 (-) Transcript_769:1188-1826(-)